MRFWDQFPSWEEAADAWDLKAKEAAQERPIKKLKVLPQMPGIVDETAHHLRWKSFKYMISHDPKGAIRGHVLKHPLRYGINYLKSLLKKKSYRRDGDFFLYGLPSVEAFEKKAAEKNSLLVVGFSYCQKPHECPSGRFNDKCVRDLASPICRQCDVGQVLHAVPIGTVPLIIPTIHYIGEHIFKLIEANPHKQIIFLITACELTLEMFGDWGNMAKVVGIGIRLDGRICNTMKAFELSEEGIKPGLTVVTEPTQKRVLDLVRRIRSNVSV